MAEKFQPMMSAPDTPYYVNPGVQGAASPLPGLLGDAAKVGVAAYEGTQFKNQRLEQDKAIQQYENYVAVGDISMDDLASQRNAADSIWKQYEDQVPNPDTAALNKLEATYGASIDKLKKAQEQGVLSDSEFLARITKITREAINKNPWMESELYSAAQTHLKAMGITDMMVDRNARAKDVAQQQDEARKFYRTAFKDNNMLDEFNPNGTEAQWQSQLQGIQQEKRELEGARRLLDKGTTLDDLQVQRMLDGNGMKFHYMDVKDLGNSWITSLKQDPSSTNLQSVLSNAELVAGERVRAFKASMGSAAFTDKGKALIASVEKDWSDLTGTIRNAGTAQDATKMLTNALDARKAIQGLQLREKVNPEQLDLATKVMTGFGLSIKDMMTKMGLPALTNATGLVSTLMMGEEANRMELSNSILSGGANAVFSGIISNQKGYASQEGINALTRIASSVTQSVSNGTVSMEQGLPAVNGMLKTVAENATMLKGQPANPEFSRQIKQATDISMGRLVPEMGRIVQETLDRNPGAEIEYDVLPNGTFIINTGSSTADDKFNKKFSNTINNALDAYAASQGVSREKVAGEFYTKYLAPMVGKDPEVKMLSAGELNIQSPREAQAAYQTGRITQKEFEAILKEGFDK